MEMGYLGGRPGGIERGVHNVGLIELVSRCEHGESQGNVALQEDDPLMVLKETALLTLNVGLLNLLKRSRKIEGRQAWAWIDRWNSNSSSSSSSSLRLHKLLSKHYWLDFIHVALLNLLKRLAFSRSRAPSVGDFVPQDVCRWGRLLRLTSGAVDMENHFALAKEAYRLVVDAWLVLSVPAQRALFDEELKMYPKFRSSHAELRLTLGVDDVGNQDWLSSVELKDVLEETSGSTKKLSNEVEVMKCCSSRGGCRPSQRPNHLRGVQLDMLVDKKRISLCRVLYSREVVRRRLV
nr:uncharacterized protein LOC109173489 [Ipomoea batatas]